MPRPGNALLNLRCRRMAAKMFGIGRLDFQMFYDGFARKLHHLKRLCKLVVIACSTVQGPMLISKGSNQVDKNGCLSHLSMKASPSVNICSASERLRCSSTRHLLACYLSIAPQMPLKPRALFPLSKAKVIASIMQPAQKQSVAN